MAVYSVGEIAEKINAQAREIAPDLLPNGRLSQCRTKWMFSGIPDTGKSESAWVHLSGAKIGKWFDMGNAAPGEDKGDILDLLQLKLGLADKRAAIEEAKQRLGLVDDWKPGKPAKLPPEELQRRADEARARAEAREAEAEKERAAKARGAKALYLRGSPIAGTWAERYLMGRGIEAGAKWPGVLRFHSEVYLREEGCKVPAMLAAVYRADGVQIGTHRTFLANEGGRIVKARVDRPKRVLGSVWGGFIPISKGSSAKSMRDMPEGEPVYVTEGIEDALVVRMMMPGARIVAAYSLGNVGAIVLPAAARRLVIVCDRDSNAKAQEQLERSIAQQQARGLDVQLVMPPEEWGGVPIKDINDWWLALKAQGARARQSGDTRGVA
ncbi:MAG: toprim domain-containing protein [Pseudomonadota bacterium]|nr:toprim domain-containing protein [Pseudomonadota bacterium]